MKEKITLGMCVLVLSALNAKETVSLEEITVTAQKQEERYIDVPISLSVLDEFDIEDKGINDFGDLANHASGLAIFDAGGTGILSPSLRGIASNTGAENLNVGIYVDGIPYVGTFGNELILVGMERVEVLKGPQSVLYGKNSYAGVINIVSKEPRNHFEGSVGLEFGNYDKKIFNLNINTPIIKDKLLLDFYLRHSQKDGFIKNNYLGNYDNYKEDDFGKIYLKYIFSDYLKFSFISSILQKDDGAPSWNVSTASNLRETNSNFQGVNQSTNNANVFRVDYDYSGYNFSSISTHKTIDGHIAYDGDLSPVDAFHITGEIDTKEYSQEFRVIKEYDSFKYLFGVYFDSMTKKRENLFNSATFQDFETKSNTASIFANVDLQVLDNLVLSVGSRIDREKIELEDSLLGANDTNSYTNFSPRINLKYNLNDDTMIYSTVSKGFKSGGYYMFAPTPDERWADKESALNYEIGAKTYLTNNLLLSTAIFYMDIEDKQVITHISPITSYIQNAAKAESKGIELDIDYNLNENLKLYTALGYSDSKLKEFRDAQGDYSGNRNPFSPKYTYSLGAKYRSDMGVFANINLRGQGEMFSDKQNLAKTDKFQTIDIKVGYEKKDYEIYLYANNIMDKENDTNYGTVIFLSEPREIGVKLKYRF